jgi:hypothetical protein
MESTIWAIVWQSSNARWNVEILTPAGQSHRISWAGYLELMNSFETYMCNMNEDGTIPCNSCGKPTMMLSTELCDACWERLRFQGEAKLTDAQYRTLLDLWVHADPSPLTAEQDTILTNMLNDEAKARGHFDYIVAYHKV